MLEDSTFKTPISQLGSSLEHYQEIGAGYFINIVLKQANCLLDLSA